MKIDATLDKNSVFNLRCFTWHEGDDGSTVPNKIGSWLIKGACVLDRDNEALDVPLIASLVTDGDDGLFDLTMSIEDRDKIFDTFNKKNAIDFEIRANFFNGTDLLMAQGNLLLRRSRGASSLI